jgi:hypothetical protein
MGRMSLVVFLLLILCTPLLCEEFIPARKEAPESLFELEIGDAEVDFFLIGSWTFTLFGATGIVIKPDTGIQILDYFPGMEQGIVFKQVPDLTFSLWLMERYFLELTYTGDFKDNLIIAGYEGKEGELLQHVYIGNTDINISPYPYMDIADIEHSSLGAEALFTTPTSRHELLLRYEYSEEVQKVFEGLYEIQDLRFKPEDYMQGRFFRLPDSDVTELAVYIEDNNKGTYTGSDGRKYRKATFDDVVLDSTNGLVSLREIQKGRILVHYKKNGVAVGTDNPGLGVDALPGQDIVGNIDLTELPVRFYFDMGTYLTQNMSEKQIILNGSFDTLLLWEKGVFSPFEISGSYPVTEALPANPGLVDVTIVDKGGTSEKTGLAWNIELEPDLTFNRIIASHNDDIRGEFRNLYPFPDPEHNIYGPRRDVTRIHTDYEILVKIKTPITQYLLEPDIIPGSVHVTRNGIKETRFEVDYISGLLTFLTEISPLDRIEVIYRKRAETMENGDLLFACGNTTSLNDTTKLELAAGLRWNALPGTYSEKAYSKIGSVLGSCSLNTTLDWLTLSARAGVSFTNPDTTGIFRLLGMEKSGMDIILSEEIATPSSLPDPYEPALSMNTRGQLFYKNYREYGLLGDVTLKEITWDIPDDQVFPYETGSKPGPYEVRGSSTSKRGSSLVMDFSIPTADDWVGIQIPVDPGYGHIDLSGITSITLSYRTIDVSDEVNLSLQIGEIAEDIDGDGKLDKESSTASRGYSFDDTSNNVTLYIGGGPKGEGNNAKNSEDIDENYLLDPEPEVDPHIFAASPLPLSAGTTGWQTYPIYLTDVQREKLIRTNFFRIVLTEESGNSVTGKLLIDRIYLSGPHFWREMINGDSSGETLSIREINEYMAPLRPSTPLEIKYTSVGDIFHPGSEEQKVCEITWDDFDTGENWECINYSLPDTEGIRYNELSFYLCITELSGIGSGELTLSLLDSSGRGVSVTIPSADLDLIPEWELVEVALDTKEVFLGNSQVNWNLTVDKNYGSLNRFGIQFTALSDNQDGTLFIDEIHLKRPVTSLGAAVGLNAEINLPGNIVTVNGFPILSDVLFKENASFTSEGFSPLYGQHAPAMMFNSLSELSLGLLISRIDTHLQVQGNDDDLDVSGGHTIRIPKDQYYVTATDTFTILPGNDGYDMFRANSLAFTTDNNIFSTTLSTDATRQESSLIQNWGITSSLLLFEIITITASESYGEFYTDVSRDDDWYLAAWIDAYRYVLPLDSGDLIQRTGTLLPGITLSTLPVGADVSGNLTWYSRDISSENRTFGSGLTYSFSLPVNVSHKERTIFTLTPSYSRALSVEQSETGNGSFGDDIAAWGRTIGEHQYLFNQLPFVELFSPESEELFQEINTDQECTNTTYNPAFSLTFTKGIGSRIYDLFLPSALEYTMGKQMKKQSDLYNFVNIYSLSSRSHAINLFGKYGVYSLVDFYTVDEYSTSITLSLTQNPDHLIWDFTLGNYLSFEDEKKNLFFIDNQFRVWEDEVFALIDTATLSYQWNVFPEKGLPLPLISEENVENGYIANTETIGLTIKDEPEADSFHLFTLLLGHNTSFTYPEKGYINGGINIGVDIEHLEGGEPIIRIGFKAVIEARLQW